MQTYKQKYVKVPKLTELIALDFIKVSTKAPKLSCDIQEFFPKLFPYTSAL